MKIRILEGLAESVPEEEIKALAEWLSKDSSQECTEVILVPVSYVFHDVAHRSTGTAVIFLKCGEVEGQKGTLCNVYRGGKNPYYSATYSPGDQPHIGFVINLEPGHEIYQGALEEALEKCT